MNELQSAFGNSLLQNTPLARYTSARVGGPADSFLEVATGRDLARAVELAWQTGLPYLVLGGGSNLLVADAGVRGLVILNRARRVKFSETPQGAVVWAESGANFGAVARQAGARGLSGLEWAAGIPGTVGGAVVGNAGAHGGDMAGNLQVADILHRLEQDGSVQALRETWTAEALDFSYRSSRLKRNPGTAVVLAARLHLQHGSTEAVQAKMEQYVQFRRRTQPPGASMGSMFKNPPGDYAGRLIEAAGLKGTRVGDAQVSELHANFFVNLGRASAADIYNLICLARETVSARFGVELEMEVELAGAW